MDFKPPNPIRFLEVFLECVAIALRIVLKHLP